ncbi:hypothetical protein GOV05_04865 [Candidatus Woesearchaeota archaeon]|nr:hypothetical protein [Candidatus Woesearchaeota archaeon]
MISDIDKRENPNKKNYPKEEIDVAYKFSSKIYKEMGDYIKAIVLFGSTARKTKTKGDIDILIVLDDVSIVLSPELMEAYKVISQKIIGEISRRLHVTTLKYSTFFELSKAGDPIAINILRDGVPLLDTGFFEPYQSLLSQGRIRPTRESVMVYHNKASNTVENSKRHLLSAVMDLYWAVVDSAHAALMSVGEIPPSPMHIADLVEEKFVKPGHLDKKYASIVRNFYKLSKMITYRELREVKGSEYDNHLRDALEFLEKMDEFVLDKKKKSASKKK